ncbi:hypothetical protein GCM10022225_76880 [Plantactinospora mayteni]|uniref:Uncharacterized protein n=1 Tax=Plantactinospora mayteni TaxID=566021 RepID=A0ABQ4F230_9ACTN|nr:hypothetical protein [Plantactinospora mayteni]GIH00979.1 hypothetical protein Pma05_75510 [Plantactinospora mayteni]
MAKKRLFTVLAATALAVGSIAAGPAAQASAARTSGSPAVAYAGTSEVGNSSPGVLIDARPCNTSQTPRQIRLVLAPGAVICYGGTVGSWDLGELYVQSLVAGGYHGYLVCENSGGGSGFVQFFSPGQIFSINDTCQTLAITPPR